MLSNPFQSSGHAPESRVCLMNINVAVTSMAGVQGKTTVASHMLMPLLPSPVLIEIEDWNASGAAQADLSIGAKAFYPLAAQMNTDLSQSFILDIGASNCKQMFKHFDDLTLTRQQINFFCIPVRAGSKERIDTLMTIKMLLDMGVPPSSLVVIAMAVSDIDLFDAEFGPLSQAAQRDGFCFASQAVLFSPIFDMLKGSKRTVFDVVRENPDFRALREQHRGDEQKLVELGNQMLIYSLSHRAARNLTSVFNSTPLANAILY